MNASSLSRRRLFSRVPVAAAVTALAASYGTLLAFMARFLFPADKRSVAWMYVAQLARVKAGDAILYKTPSGETVNIARRTQRGSADDFIALSSTCPHLGCQVHWEGQNNRFFCPCHNGAFAPDGTATSGPPAEAKQSLPSYPLRVKAGLLFIEVPTERLQIGALAQASEPRGKRGAVIARPARTGPGHDPCLAASAQSNVPEPNAAESSVATAPSRSETAPASPWA